MRSRARQAIDQIAYIILSSDLTLDEALTINEATGWTFDVEWDGQEYAGGWFTHVEGLRLGPKAIERAYALAMANQ